MIFNEIKCHFNTCLGLVGGCIPCIPPVSAPARQQYNQTYSVVAVEFAKWPTFI